MRTKRYGIVEPMPNDTTSGYGPNYSSDPKGNGFLVWLEDCHSPAVYLIRCADIEEAWGHATIVLCEIDQEVTDYAAQQYRELDSPDGSYSASAMFNRIDAAVYAAGSSSCDDGTIRYTETLKIVELQPSR